METLIENAKEALEIHLQLLVERVDFPHPSLKEGVRYMLLEGGKRLRPLFAIAVAEACGAKLETILQPAAALEMVHTYSLIHDDLPCMDDDDIRRGKPTLHRYLDEATALLVGDFLLTYAFETLATSPDLSSTTLVQLLIELAKAAGGEGMIGGQALDLTHPRTRSSFQRAIAKLKTGALFQAAFSFGAIVAGIEKQKLHDISLLGQDVGILFQLIDDLIDQEIAPFHTKQVKEEIEVVKTKFYLLFNNRTHALFSLFETLEQLEKPSL